MADDSFFSDGSDFSDDDFFQTSPTTEQFDSNGDGIIDSFMTSYDYNMDGVIDAQEMYLDTNGDGFIDSQQLFMDTNFDGLFDTQQSFNDLNYDGVTDMVSQTTYIDSDGNGIIDTVTYAEDSNGDGIFDAVENYTDANEDGTFDQVDYNNGAYFPDSGAEDDTPNYDPNDPNIDQDSIVGNPGEDMQNWEFQGESGPCALFAQMFAVEELTGQDFDMDDFMQIAAQNGWYDGGTPIPYIGKMLEYYGLDTEVHESGSMDDIKDCLENGGKVVVAVDGDEIWYGDDSATYAPNDPNHAIEVIGIDYTDPDNPMVILNDSGTPDGQGLMVPVDQFEAAWEDSGCYMVEAYN